MKLLAFDAASSACSAAVFVDGRVAAERFAAMERGQAEALVPMIEAVMAEAGLAFAALDALAVTVGPGAFTGVRIGLAAAHGLALARSLPCVGLTTLEAVAFPATTEMREGETLVAAVESKREELFLQPFRSNLEAVGAAFAASPEGAGGFLPKGRLLLAGDGAARLRSGLGALAEIAQASGPPRAAAFAALGAARLRQTAPSALPRPLYLRPPDARPMSENRS
ncbi:MAG TPA: tRNA (adenosine(37)-N6)-threonylcarbamoyltransferase complex dimerization subunit type 1 TsaB [Alphaproteobacteria bacterium]|nr:tRNA (adenosine(37)-N6)-threonylcarbamoyltransferase complex dimerization subunit type 1 TsaB [Alphaproteobacteria bacterium]